MSADINIAIFGGRLTNDPSSVGTNGCKFDVANNRVYRTKEGERQEETTYMPVTCWGPLADIVIKSCKKGDPVIVEGRFEVRKFSGEDGVQKKFFGLVAKDVRFLSSKSSNVEEEETRSSSKNNSLGQGLPSGVPEDAVKLLASILQGGKRG